MRILLKISYLGTNYHGWQVQPNGLTVQEVLQDALESVYKIRLGVTGCSRTDAGVHANEFYCHYDTDKYIPEQGIVYALNSALPDDVAALECKYVADGFHARYSSRGKNYIYRIYNSKIPNPFENDRCWRVARKLDVQKMDRFAKELVGTHDFIGFSSSGRTVEDTVRTVYDCSVKRDGDYVLISVSADGFLYNMVRIIVGTLVDVSDGKISVDNASEILASCRRDSAGVTAPPQGLFLNKVLYD